ncbi:hypothetical protein [Streptomyces olindensis]
MIDVKRPVFARLFPHMSKAVDRGGMANTAALSSLDSSAMSW